MSIASKITTSIPKQAFEYLRDRIAEILLVEITNQASINTDAKTRAALAKTKIYAERFVPFNEDEMLAVDLYLYNSRYDNKHQMSQRGNYIFYMDVFGRTTHTNNEPGDRRNVIMIQTLIGIIRVILEHPEWVRLGFDDQKEGLFVNRSEITSFNRMQEDNTRDAGNILMYRMIFEVVANESIIFDNSIPLTRSTTNVEINETDIGLEYIYEA